MKSKYLTVGPRRRSVVGAVALVVVTACSTSGGNAADESIAAPSADGLEGVERLLATSVLTSDLLGGVPQPWPTPDPDIDSPRDDDDDACSQLSELQARLPTEAAWIQTLGDMRVYDDLVIVQISLGWSDHEVAAERFADTESANRPCLEHRVRANFEEVASRTGLNDTNLWTEDLGSVEYGTTGFRIGLSWTKNGVPLTRNLDYWFLHEGSVVSRLNLRSTGAPLDAQAVDAILRITRSQMREANELAES